MENVYPTGDGQETNAAPYFLTPAQDAQLIANDYEPVPIEGKRPVADGWQRDVITPARIAAERAAHPDARNTGIRTGIVVADDIDLRDPNDATELRRIGNEKMGESNVTRIGAKGSLTLYRNEAPIAKVAIRQKYSEDGQEKIRTLVELLGVGQQFAAYGLHPDGPTYTWPNEQHPLNTAADWLTPTTPEQMRECMQARLSYLEQTGRYSGLYLTGDMNDAAWREARQTSDPIYEHDYVAMLGFVDCDTDRDTWRNDLASQRSALVMRPNANRDHEPLTDEEMYQHALGWSQGRYDHAERYKDDPPWSYSNSNSRQSLIGEDSVAHNFWSLSPVRGGQPNRTVASLIAEAKANGYKGRIDSHYDPRSFGDQFKDVADLMRERFQPDSGLDLKWPFRYIRDRDTALALPEPEMLIEKIVPAGKLILPWGDTGAGKTYFLAEMATAVAMDRPAFGKFKIMRPGIGVVFAGEDATEFEQSRLVAIEQHYNRSLQGLIFTVPDAIPLDDPDMAEKYFEELRRLEKHTGEKIITLSIDTLQRSLGSLKQNEVETAQKFTKEMEVLIAEFGCTIFVTGHQPKAGAQQGISGTKGFMNNAPVTPHIILESEKPFIIRVEFEPKFRIGPKPEPFMANGVPVALPKPINGYPTDLIMVAMAPTDQARADAARNAKVHELAEIHRALVALGAPRSVEGGIYRDNLADVILAGRISGRAMTETEKLRELEAIRKALTDGSHWKNPGMGRNGTPRPKLPPRYFGWFGEQKHATAKGAIATEIRWFIPPDVIDVPDEETAENIPW